LDTFLQTPVKELIKSVDKIRKAITFSSIDQFDSKLNELSLVIYERSSIKKVLFVAEITSTN